MSNNDWMTKLSEIKAARVKFEKGVNMMTSWERQELSESIKAAKARDYSRIYEGTKARLDDAKSAYKAAAAKREAAIAREINSWDPAKLNAELQTFQTRVGMELGKPGAGIFGSGKPIAKRIDALYREALASGDKYKMRAAAEGLQGLNPDLLPRDQRVEVMTIGHEAAAKLDALRFTDDIKAAIAGEDQAVKQLQDELQFVQDAGEVMRDNQTMFGSPLGGFAKLARTVKFERGESGVTIKILELDDPELTGLIVPDEPDTIGGNNG